MGRSLTGIGSEVLQFHGALLLGLALNSINQAEHCQRLLRLFLEAIQAYAFIIRFFLCIPFCFTYLKTKNKGNHK